MLEVNKQQITSFLKGLRRESGGYAETLEGIHSLRSTLSVVKALKELDEFKDGIKGKLPWIVDFTKSCRDKSGGFSITPKETPTPYDTANGLILLKNLDEEALLDEYIAKSTAFIIKNAETKFDHFMLIATYEECCITQSVPQTSITFLEELLEKSIEQKNVVDTAIAASALIRAGVILCDKKDILSILLNGQNTDEGGFGSDKKSVLFITYCVMRALVLLKMMPNTTRLISYLNSLKTSMAFTDLAKSLSPSMAGATYMNLSMRTWLHELQSIAVHCAATGDLASIKMWLEQGGVPNLYDKDGLTPLLSAAAYGKANIVDLLLNHKLQGVPHASPEVRYKKADALPIYMAGQSGDLFTIKVLLTANPEHINEISNVNGHTVLLQASFYGKDKHLTLARYLLDNVANIKGLPESALKTEQKKLLCATNVRGYSALDMQDLWHNEAMKELLLSYYDVGDDSIRQMQKDYYNDLLIKISSPQMLTEKLLTAIDSYILEGDEFALSEISEILEQELFDINRLGGPLLMTPLIHALTGVDTNNPDRAKRRYLIAKTLLKAGADPKICEKHPMAIGAVIRASVLNNFKLLKLLSEHMTDDEFTHELNVSPAVNGLTAMHDAIHRALTSPASQLQNHIDQIEWMIKKGACLDIPDNTGQTQYDLIQSAKDNSSFPKKNVMAVILAVDKFNK